MNAQSKIANPKSKIHGFSLIELLVVILILSLLAAFLLPALVKARRRAGDARCMSNLHQLYVAHQAYLNDFPDGLFSMGLSDVNMGGAPEELYEEKPDFLGDWHGLWMGQLEPYVKNTKVYECPKADGRYVNTFNGQPLGYALNVSFHLVRQGKETPKVGRHYADHLLFVDAPFYKTSYLSHDLLMMGFANASRHWIVHLQYCPTDRDRRHAGGSNAVFFDGHAEPLDFAAIWRRLNFFGYDHPPNGYKFR